MAKESIYDDVSDTHIISGKQLPAGLFNDLKEAVDEVNSLVRILSEKGYSVDVTTLPLCGESSPIIRLRVYEDKTITVIGGGQPYADLYKNS